MKICGAVLALLFGVVMINAEAVSWVRLTDSKGSSISVDRDSIQRTGEIVAAWYQRDFNHPMPTEKGSRYQSVKVLNYYNCASDEVAAAQWITYEKPRGQGKEISNERVEPLLYSGFTAGEANEYVFKFVCQQRRRGKK